MFTPVGALRYTCCTTLRCTCNAAQAAPPVRLPARCPQRAPRRALGEVGRLPRELIQKAPLLYLRPTPSPAFRPCHPGTPPFCYRCWHGPLIKMHPWSLDQDASLALRSKLVLPEGCGWEKRRMQPLPDKGTLGTRLEWGLLHQGIWQD